jgi:hypothetical protein
VNAPAPDQLFADATKKKPTRFRNTVAGVYFTWSLLCFFGSIGSDGHSWWPIFLYPLIWPLSPGIERLDDFALNLVDPAAVQPSFWTINDYAMGFLYIVGGTAWWWLISTLLFKLCARVRKCAFTT